MKLLSGGGVLTYKREGGAPTNASNHEAISDNFLAKKGSLNDRSKKGGSLGVKMHKIWAILTHFFLTFLLQFANFFQNWMILTGKFDRKSKYRGSLGVRLWKRGTFGDKPMYKEKIYWQIHDASQPMGVHSVYFKNLWSCICTQYRLEHPPL